MQSNCDDVLPISLRIRGGLPELALSQFGTVDLHIFFRDALESTTAVSLDFLAQDDPEGFRSEIRRCLLPWTRTLAHTIRLKPLQYALSYCQKHSIDVKHYASMEYIAASWDAKACGK